MGSEGSGDAFGEEWGRIVFTHADVDRMSQILETFIHRSQVPGAFLFSKNGYMVAKAGISSSYGLNTLCDLAIKWFNCLREKTGQPGDPGSLIQNPEEGQEHVKLSRVHRWAILAVVFEELNAVGKVREEVLRVSDSLTEVFVENERRRSGSERP